MKPLTRDAALRELDSPRLGIHVRSKEIGAPMHQRSFGALHGSDTQTPEDRAALTAQYQADCDASCAEGNLDPLVRDLREAGLMVGQAAPPAPAPVPVVAPSSGSAAVRDAAPSAHAALVSALVAADAAGIEINL